jgi:hypothetical protein
LISGRFDKPHCGHIKTITDLGQRFKKVLVVVLDHHEQMYSVTLRAQILREVLENYRGEYDVVINNHHFGEISAEELQKFAFDVYAAGNPKVLKHIEATIKGIKRRKIEVIWVNRPYEYDSSTERTGALVREQLK